jgi:hypothetical protein
MIRTGISCEGGARTGCGLRVQGGRSTGRSAGGRQRFGGPDESWGLKACGWNRPEGSPARVGRIRISMRGATRRRDRIDQGYGRTAVQPPRPAGGAAATDPVARHGHDPAGRTALMRQRPPTPTYGAQRATRPDGDHDRLPTSPGTGLRRPAHRRPRGPTIAPAHHEARHVGGASHSAVGPAPPPTADASGAARSAPTGPPGCPAVTPAARRHVRQPPALSSTEGALGGAQGTAPRRGAPDGASRSARGSTSPHEATRHPQGDRAGPTPTRDRRPALTHPDSPDAPDRHRQ